MLALSSLVTVLVAHTHPCRSIWVCFGGLGSSCTRVRRRPNTPSSVCLMCARSRPAALRQRDRPVRSVAVWWHAERKGIPLYARILYPNNLRQACRSDKPNARSEWEQVYAPWPWDRFTLCLVQFAACVHGQVADGRVRDQEQDEAETLGSQTPPCVKVWDNGGAKEANRRGGR